jgi:acetamidase/formamidase
MLKSVTLAPLFFAGALVASAPSAMAASHELKLIPANTHVGFDASLKPVLRVAPGDTITVEALVSGGMQRLKAAGARDDEIPDSIKEMDKYMREHGMVGATPLTGPIYVEGAETGDTLEVRILPGFEFLHPYGWTGFRGKGTLPDDFPYARYKLYRVDAAGNVAFNSNITVKASPFWGTIGIAPPAESGRISSGPPGVQAGNLDFKELVAGSTLYIPVNVPGALLSLGDGHIVQGDGEINGGALETSLRGTVQVFVRKDKPMRWPRAESPTHYMTLGLNPDLNEAARMAVREMIDFLVTEKGMTRDEAYLLCSQAVDLHVTQLVDGVKGIHAMIAKSIFH